MESKGRCKVAENEDKLEHTSMRYNTKRTETHDSMGVLQEKLAPSITELNTYLAQEMQKLKKVPGEGRTVVGLTAAPYQQGELADDTCEL